jgi:apolipoprotein N-acyltransferase
VKLVPFSEALPFQGLFPILSRVNLGQADFKPGSVPVVYSIGSLIRGAPFICFDIIYPSFVRKRAAFGANILIHITNDGWFGKSSGPFQHALMSQQRCIENGISLARCANSGISMLVDQYGRIIAKTRLGVRTILSGDIPLARVPTLYTALGDWPVGVSACIAVVQLCIVIFRRYVRKKETQQ